MPGLGAGAPDVGRRVVDGPLAPAPSWRRVVGASLCLRSLRVRGGAARVDVSRRRKDDVCMYPHPRLLVNNERLKEIVFSTFLLCVASFPGFLVFSLRL